MRGQFYRDSLYAHSTIIIDHLVETFLSFPKKESVLDRFLLLYKSFE